MTIAQFAKKKGCKVERLAQKMHVSKSVVYSYGNRERSEFPRIGTIEKVANALTALGFPTNTAEIVSALTEGEQQ